MENIIKVLQDNLERHTNIFAYDNFFSETYRYSLLPPGKMFRPLLVWAQAQEFSDNHALLASCVETHHTYTLIHDDMPCMDDDDTRRGKASTHKRFGQWQALLSGDGLLNQSYALVSKMNHVNLGHILNYMTWSLGPKGLILGQALDLSGEMTKSFEDLVLTHKLKTARLIQTCLVCSELLNKEEVDFKQLKSLHKLGEHMGVAFQLLDDLCELEDEKLSQHESDVNPWLRYKDQCHEHLNFSLSYISDYFDGQSNEKLQDVFAGYTKKIRTLLTGSQNIIENHIGDQLNPVISFLDRFSSRN